MVDSRLLGLTAHIDQPRDREWLRGLNKKFCTDAAQTPHIAFKHIFAINDTFAACDANDDGLLDRAEFAAFVTASNQNGVNRGLKNRETTEEFMDMVYPAFNGFNEATEGVSKGEILTILQYLNAHMD